MCAARAVAVAVEPEPPNPIDVTRCSVSEQPVIENPKIGFRPAQVSGVTIVYTNTRDVAAAEIRFRIRYGGLTRFVVDRGALPPGKKISREFSTIDAIFSGDSADCSATSASFTDGTKWSAADTATPAPRR